MAILFLIMATPIAQVLDNKLQSIQTDINKHIDSKFTELSELLKCPQVGLIPRVETLEKVVKLDKDCLVNRCNDLHTEILSPRGGYNILKQTIYGSKGGVKLGLLKEFKDCQAIVGDQFIGNSALSLKLQTCTEAMGKDGRLDALAKKLNDPTSGICTRVDNLEKVSSVADHSFCISKEDYDALLERIKTLEGSASGTVLNGGEIDDSSLQGFIARLDTLEHQMGVAGEFLDTTTTRLDTLDSRVTMNTAKLLGNNIKIMGIPFQDREDTKQECLDFFDKYMSFKAQKREIIAAFRMPGTKFVYIDRKKVRLPPLMFVKCSDSLKRKVEEGLPLLDGKKHEKYKFRLGIKRHEPDAIVAAKIRYQEQIGNLIARNELKSSDENKDTFFFRGASLFVNGKKVVDPLVPPSPKLLLSLSQSEVRRLETLPLTTGVEEEIDRGSRYFSYAAKVANLEEVKQLYNRVRLQHLAATHVSVGFRFGITPSTPHSPTPVVVRTGGSPDGEHQADIRICHAINKSTALDVAVFVVRYYGGAPLGSARLKNVFNYAIIALDQLREAARAVGLPLRTLPQNDTELDTNPTSPKSVEGGSQEDLFSDRRMEASSLPAAEGDATVMDGPAVGAAEEVICEDEGDVSSSDGEVLLGKDITSGQGVPSGTSLQVQNSHQYGDTALVSDDNVVSEMEGAEDEKEEEGGGDDHGYAKSQKTKKKKKRKLTVTPKKVRRERRLNKQVFNEFEHY